MSRVETYYRNWDNNQFGDTMNDETATKSAYFNIIKGLKNTYGFETNMYGPNLRVGEDERLISKVDDNNYLYYALRANNLCFDRKKSIYWKS